MILCGHDCLAMDITSLYVAVRMHGCQWAYLSLNAIVSGHGCLSVDIIVSGYDLSAGMAACQWT